MKADEESNKVGQKKCDQDEQCRILCATIEALTPLYSDAKEDRPDSLLGELPEAPVVVEALRILIDALLPGRLFQTHIRKDELPLFLTRRLSGAWRSLRPCIEKVLPYRWLGQAARHAGKQAMDKEDMHRLSTDILHRFYERLPFVRRMLIEDVRAAYDGDPAALTYAEVQLAYPGLLAVCSHRIAHELYRLDVPVIPRIMGEWTHSFTGVDIHPGARIGHGFFIDHATGVVIGETTSIGNNVKVYQGVTLGARSFPLDENGNPIKHVKRHPTVEDDVVIYANATILGGDTVIGRGSTIGGNVFLMNSVPPGSFVAHRHPDLSIKSRGDNRNEG